MSKGFFKQTVVLMLCSILFFIIPAMSTKAALADGTYSINYTVIQPDSDSVSIANDYFQKPATLTVDNGAMKVKITLKNSKWITDFNGSAGGNSVVSTSESADTRIVQFNVSSLSTPLEASMKVDIDDMNYHHEYTVRINFDESSASLISGSSTESKKTESSSNTTTSENSTNNQSSNTETAKEENPQTGDSTSLIAAAVLLAASTAVFVRRYKTSK